MELEPRTTAPAHATGAVEFVPLAAISDDATFRLRDVGDVSALAASIGRLGHLVPVELRRLPASAGGPRFQVVAGFRRLAALRLLARERVLARVHAVLDDDDAWGIALAQALLREPLLATDLEALRARLSESRVAPWADELVDEALVRAPVDPEQRERFLAFLAGAPVGDSPLPHSGGGEGQGEGKVAEEPPEEAAEDALEVTADELALDLAQRMFDTNQDLALAFEAWAELPEEGRRMIIEQARYVAELYPHLTRGRR
jgi:ParB-like chromosome segregation protein Spo0J